MKADNESLAAMARVLGVVVSELRAGTHPGQAIESAAHDAPVETAKALRRITGSASEVSCVEMDITETRAAQQLLRAWVLTQRHGLPLGEVLDAVRQDLRTSIRVIHHNRARMAGARSSAAVLAALPVLGVLFGQLMGAHPLKVLTGTPLGQVLSVVGCFLTWVGVWWSLRLSGRASWCSA